ncbi:hypothetical protein M422DRAFT_41641 [Sphaerobolus stellatus SS14]|nr:hypothetical protein M422DRAFT_41641 [Sphaerobolus stellatus SS14]
MSLVEPPPAFTDSLGFPMNSQDHNGHDPSPQYREERPDDLWEQWLVADTARQKLTDIQQNLAHLEPELAARRKIHEQLKQKSAQLFEELHRRKPKPKGKWNGLKRVKSVSSSNSMDKANEEFEVAHRQEISMMGQIAVLGERAKELNRQLQQYTSKAAETEHLFEMLGARFSVSASNGSLDLEVTTAEQILAEASSTLENAEKKFKDYQRGQTTIQHAHHYLHLVLKTIDSIRGTAVGRALFGGLSEVSRRRDYQVASETAVKAQVCFTESVRVLGPYLEEMPKEIQSDFSKAKELGLLQAEKVYNLIYSKIDTVTQSVELMLERQETVFACLTRAAVWVQNKVPEVEAEVRTAHATRDTARRNLAVIWNDRSSGGS